MNYKLLIEDLINGKFNNKQIGIVMDNDGGYFKGLTDCDDTNESLESAASEKYGKFGGERDVVEILSAIGFGCDRC